MSDSGSNPMETPRWKFILRASGLSAFIAITMSSLIFGLLVGRPSSLDEAAAGFIDVWVVGAVPAGFFGLLAGALGGGWFSFRRGHITSLSLLLVEAAAVGTLLGLMVAPIILLLDDSWYGPTKWMFWLFFFSVGCSAALMFAYFSRRAILGRPGGNEPK